jgi:hypothetical protein
MKYGLLIDPTELSAKDCARFWASIDKSAGKNGCWFMYGYASDLKRPQFYVNGKKPAASRIAYALGHDVVVPPHMNVCHDCPSGDNRLCLNFRHLWLGTQQQNLDDMSAKGNSMRGSKNTHSRLDVEQVLAIRDEYTAGGISMPKLAKKYGVTYNAVFVTVHRKNWSHV